MRVFGLERLFKTTVRLSTQTSSVAGLALYLVSFTRATLVRGKNGRSVYVVTKTWNGLKPPKPT